MDEKYPALKSEDFPRIAQLRSNVHVIKTWVCVGSCSMISSFCQRCSSSPIRSGGNRWRSCAQDGGSALIRLA